MNRRALIRVLAIAAVGAAGVLALAARSPLAPAVPPRVVNSVTAFATGHPEWAALRDGRRDTTPLLMGHALHMDPQLPGGPLTCVSCHVEDDGGLYMRPIEFETHCAQCHEANLGRINVAEGLVAPIPTPHGSAPGVLAAIESRIDAMMAANPEKFVIASPTEGAAPTDGAEATSDGQSTSSRRRGRSPQPKTVEVPQFATVEAREEWIQGLRSAAQAKAQNSCAYCHVSPEPASGGGEWTVEPPDIPTRWLSRSHNSHAAHSMLACDQCHQARTSAATADVLLPGIDSCRQCHQPHEAGTGGAPTDCVLCHAYHGPAPIHEGVLRSSNLGSGSGAQSTPTDSAP